MRVHACIILLLVGTWILTACGVKSPPRPPKPKKAPATTSEIEVVPREGAAKKVSGTFSTILPSEPVSLFFTISAPTAWRESS